MFYKIFASRDCNMRQSVATYRCVVLPSSAEFYQCRNSSSKVVVGQQQGSYKGYFGPYLAISPRGSQGSLRLAFSQPLAPPYKHLRLIALPSLLVRLSVLGYCLPLLLYRPLLSTPYITYTRLTYSLLYTLAILPYSNSRVVVGQQQGRLSLES